MEWLIPYKLPDEEGSDGMRDRGHDVLGLFCPLLVALSLNLLGPSISIGVINAKPRVLVDHNIPPLPR